jgi:hypothetical protein
MSWIPGPPGLAGGLPPQPMFPSMPPPMYPPFGGPQPGFAPGPGSLYGGSPGLQHPFPPKASAPPPPQHVHQVTIQPGPHHGTPAPMGGPGNFQPHAGNQQSHMMNNGLMKPQLSQPQQPNHQQQNPAPFLPSSNPQSQPPQANMAGPRPAPTPGMPQAPLRKENDGAKVVEQGVPPLRTHSDGLDGHMPPDAHAIAKEESDHQSEKANSQDSKVRVLRVTYDRTGLPCPTIMLSNAVLSCFS